MDHIERIYYINLEHREDRNDQFLKEMDRLSVSPDKVERIDAIYNSQYPYIGATASHTKAVKTFLESPYKLALICEDDFYIKDVDQFRKALTSFFETNLPFDVLKICHSISKSQETEYPGIHRLSFSQTAAAYILTKEYAPTLHANMEDCLEKSLEEVRAKSIVKSEKYYIDVHWCQCMTRDRWYAIVPRIVIQRPSFSDIERAWCDYRRGDEHSLKL